MSSSRSPSPAPTGSGQRRTHDWFERHSPGRHSAHFFPGYGHLDIFMGQRADEDIFPVIVNELEKGATA